MTIFNKNSINKKLIIVVLLFLCVFYSANSKATDIDKLTEQQLDYYCLGVTTFAVTRYDGSIVGEQVFLSFIKKIEKKYGKPDTFMLENYSKQAIKDMEELVEHETSSYGNHILNKCHKVNEALTYGY